MSINPLEELLSARRLEKRKKIQMQNAREFRPIYEQLLEKAGQPFYITATEKRSPSTLTNRLSEGLKFLIESEEETEENRKKFATLRELINFCCDNKNNRIIVKWRGVNSDCIIKLMELSSANAVVVKPESFEVLRERLLTYLSNPDDLSILRIKGENKDLKAWLAINWPTIKPENAELEILETEIVIIK